MDSLLDLKWKLKLASLCLEKERLQLKQSIPILGPMVVAMDMTKHSQLPSLSLLLLAIFIRERPMLTLFN